MLNIRLNKAIDRRKSRTVQSLIILEKNFQLRRETCTHAPWLHHCTRRYLRLISLAFRALSVWAHCLHEMVDISYIS